MGFKHDDITRALEGRENVEVTTTPTPSGLIDAVPTATVEENRSDTGATGMPLAQTLENERHAGPSVYRPQPPPIPGSGNTRYLETEPKARTKRK